MFTQPYIENCTWKEQYWYNSDRTQVHSSCHVHRSPNQEPQTLGNQAMNKMGYQVDGYEELSPSDDGHQQEHEESCRI